MVARSTTSPFAGPSGMGSLSIRGGRMMYIFAHIFNYEDTSKPFFISIVF
jgi:hypothetical protein